jgi:hypothetical protein
VNELSLPWVDLCFKQSSQSIKSLLSSTETKEQSY